MSSSFKEITAVISLQDILSNAPIVLWAVDINGKILISQGQGLESFDLKQNELVGKNYFDIYRDYPDYIAVAKKALQGEQFTEDSQINDNWFSTTYTPINNGSQVTGFSAISIDITEKKTSQIKLVESEKRFEIMANTAPILVWMSDTTKACTWFNKHWLDWTGRTMEEEYGNGWTEGVHPDDYDRCVDIYVSNFDKRQEFRMEYRLKHKSGEYRWLLDQGVPRFGHEGQFEGFIGACTDIQDEKDAQKLPNEITEAIPQGIWRTNPDGSADYFSPKFYSLVGYTPDEFLNWGWSQNIHPEDKEHVLTEWQRSRDSKQTVSIEFRIRKKTGEYRWFLTLGNPIFDKQGNVVKYYGTWTDIHDQKTANELIEYQSNLTKTITDNATSCLFMMDKNGFPTFMNPSAMEVTGYKSLDEIKDKPLHYSIHFKKPDGSHYPMEECPIDHAQTELKPVKNASEIFCRKDGTLFPVLYSVMPLEKNGEVIGSVLDFRDVTEQKNAEKSLHEAISARDEFLSIASHELKTPLTTLLIQSQLQKRMMSKGDQKAFTEERITQLMDQNERLTGRLTRLVDDMLDISRIRSGKLQIQKEMTDLSKITKDVIVRMSPSLINAGHGMPELQLETILGNWDVMRIEQVIGNLLNNAIKYGKEGPVEIRLEKQGPNAVFSVKDYGIGISPEDQKKIFNRFERAVDANDISGLGLGLYISEQIIKAHNGNIWVESERGKGSTFYFSLPIEDKNE